MKLELKKETGRSGAIFYNVYKDDDYVPNSSVYGGTIDNEHTSAYDRAVNKYNRVKKFYAPKVPKHKIIIPESSSEIIISEEIPHPLLGNNEKS